MLETLKKVFTNEVMYYVIVPILLLLFGWIKDWYDIKIQNKKIGYWEIKIKKISLFSDIAMRAYKYLALNFFSMQFVRMICDYCFGEGCIYFLVGTIYLSINIVIIIYIVHQPITKMELWTDKKIKWWLLLMLWAINTTTFYIGMVPKYKIVMLYIYSFMLIIWTVILNKCTDRAFILDKPYADIFITGAETVKNVHAGSIKKQGDWIYVNKYNKDNIEEIRIKESKIVRIDYYGNPIILFIPPKSKCK